MHRYRGEGTAPLGILIAVGCVYSANFCGEAFPDASIEYGIEIVGADTIVERDDFEIRIWIKGCSARPFVWKCEWNGRFDRSCVVGSRILLDSGVFSLRFLWRI